MAAGSGWLSATLNALIVAAGSGWLSATLIALIVAVGAVATDQLVRRHRRRFLEDLVHRLGLGGTNDLIEELDPITRSVKQTPLVRPAGRPLRRYLRHRPELRTIPQRECAVFAA